MSDEAATVLIGIFAVCLLAYGIWSVIAETRGDWRSILLVAAGVGSTVLTWNAIWWIYMSLVS